MTRPVSDAAEARLAAARDAMATAGVDFLVIGPSSDMIYLLGRKLPVTERFNALLVPASGRPIVVVPRLQVPLVEGLPLDAERKIWDETEDPIQIVSAIAEQASARRIAVNEHLHASFLLALQNRLTAASFTDAGPLIQPLRLCKDAGEVALLDDLGQRFDTVWEAFWASGPLVGATENEIAQRITALLLDHGFEAVAWCDVGGGPNGASPLHHGSARPIEPGDPVVIDFAAVRDGYYMDTCRTPVAGEPAPEFVTIYDVVSRAHDAAMAAIRPGVAAAAIDSAARDVIAAAGHGDRFIHRTGHGLGIDAHENPYIVAGNETALAPGMVFSVEPGIYVPDLWGVRIESIVLVTETGGRSFTEASRALVQMS